MTIKIVNGRSVTASIIKHDYRVLAWTERWDAGPFTPHKYDRVKCSECAFAMAVHKEMRDQFDCMHCGHVIKEHTTQAHIIACITCGRNHAVAETQLDLAIMCTCGATFRPSNRKP